MRAAVASLLSCVGCASPPAPVASPRADAPAEANVPTRSVEVLASGARRVFIADPTSYWRQTGFVELAPTVRLAISAEGRPRVTVQLWLPKDGLITARALEHQQRHTIAFPPGSEADRVSLTGSARAGWTVADVRGSRLDANGDEWFHVYRPSSGTFAAPLVGFEWRRDDEAQRDEALALLVEHVRTTPGALARRPPSRGSVSFFSRMNACEHCHFANKPASSEPNDWLPLWPTDQTGWYVPLAVMLPALALSTTRQWHDPNADDPLVDKRCDAGAPRRIDHATGSWFRCADGSVPYGIRDVARGLAQADAYTTALCRSRRHLYERMDRTAKAAFSEVMARCESPREGPALTPARP